MKYNLLFIDEMGKKVLGYYSLKKNLFHLETGGELTREQAEEKLDFVSYVTTEEAQEIRYRRNMTRSRSRIQSIPVFERNINGFKVKIGYRKKEVQP